jgi:uncharacterized PurR-regulated membrane protein YhhQ (DUF165 family)
MNQRDDTKAKEPRHSTWFVAIVALFVTCLITANIIAVKLVDLMGFILPAAIFIFPLSYITRWTEVYGRRARQVIGFFFCNLITVAAIWLPRPASASFWMDRGENGFWGHLDLAASLLAYLVVSLPTLCFGNENRHEREVCGLAPLAQP